MTSKKIKLHHRIKKSAGHSLASLVSQPKKLVTKPHHARPYRKRHFSVLTLALVLFAFLLLQVGVIIGANRSQPAPHLTATDSLQKASFTLVRSAYGFGLDFDSNSFTVSATAVDQNNVSRSVNQDELPKNQQLNLVTLRPRRGAVESRFASNQLSMQVMPTANELNALKQNTANAALTDNELAAQLFPISSSTDFDVTLNSTTSDSIGGGKIVTKRVYQYNPKFNGGLSYAVVWTGVVNGRPFALKLSGLVGSSNITDIFIPVLNSLRIDAPQKVQGATTLFSQRASAATPNTLDSKYIADSASPAVVKIYHIVCGNLVLFGNDTGYGCDGGTGTGFLVSSDGYVATNGHVTVLTAKDILVSIVEANDSSLLLYLKNILGLSAADIDRVGNDSQLLAAAISKIYDLPDEKVKLDNLKEATLVALGDQPVEIKSKADLDKLTTTTDTDTIKKAEFVAADYNSKDLLAIVSGNPDGFTSSDVSLLKINTRNAPIVRINTNPITQNQKIILLGFPGDAENELISNKTLDVSVTNGVISSTREAAGGRSKLYQSDVDASHGNSGGPALTEDGTVFGLLTYRIADDNNGNAAKSYLRDITDFQKLVSSKSITLNTKSTTQDAWVKGLDLYSKNHYSAALKQFGKVKQLYPIHRLATVYIDNSNKQIAAGKDVKDFPVVALIIGIVVALLIIVGTVIIIINHARHHRSYVLQNAFPPEPVQGTQPQAITSTTPTIESDPQPHQQN